MTPELYREIMQVYNERQTRAKRLSAARETEVYSVIPRIREIDGELLSLNVKLAKMMGFPSDLNERKKAGETLKEKTTSLLKEKAYLIAEKGYPADYLENVYICPLCRDTGFRENERCSCFKALEREKMYSDSPMKSENDNETFETFSLDYYSDEINPKLKTSERKYMENVYNICKRFSEKPEGNMLFTGRPGLGKSFLCHAITKAVLDGGTDAVCESAFVLFDRLIKNRFGKEDDNEYKDSIFNTPLLIIDDLGTENINSASSAEFFNIINYRLINKKPIIISTNFSLSDIKQLYSERIFSRIIGEYRIVSFFGSDIRLLKRKRG
ncbi:MAG: ATP-binding protein [Clostridiales bacterium]|nr:ATP-binding protein [Clostridiales bacterium]